VKSSRWEHSSLFWILNSDLTKRAEAYSWIGNLFSFFSQLKTIGSDELNKKCEHLANVYHKDIDYGDFQNECKHLKHYMVLDENCETLPALYRKIISDNLKSVSQCWNCTRSVHVHDGDQLYRGTFIFKIETYKESASQHNGAAAFELAFTQVHGKWHPEDHWLQANYKSILYK